MPTEVTNIAASLKRGERERRERGEREREREERREEREERGERGERGERERRERGRREREEEREREEREREEREREEREREEREGEEREGGEREKRERGERERRGEREIALFSGCVCEGNLRYRETPRLHHRLSHFALPQQPEGVVKAEDCPIREQHHDHLFPHLHHGLELLQVPSSHSSRPHAP